MYVRTEMSAQSSVTTLYGIHSLNIFDIDKYERVRVHYGWSHSKYDLNAFKGKNLFYTWNILNTLSILYIQLIICRWREFKVSILQRVSRIDFGNNAKCNDMIILR